MNQFAYTLLLAWRSLKARWVQSLCTILVVSLALSLFVTVAVLGQGVRDGITEASDPFGTLVIGPKGDTQQLVLSTILLSGNPLGTIDVEIFEQLEDNPLADLIIPMAMADNIGGARIIGTTTDFFALQPSIREVSPFQLADGAFFIDQELHHADDAHGEHDDDHADQDEHHDNEDHHEDEDHDGEAAHDEHDEDKEHADEDEHHDDEDHHEDGDHDGEAAHDEHDEDKDHADEDEHHDDEEHHKDEDHDDHDDEDHAAHDDHDEHGVVEAVLGSTAAIGLNLSVGDTFVTSHGAGATLNADVHDTEHTVVGILQPTNTAFDGGVFVPIASVWDTHADEIGTSVAREFDDTAADVGELTAILVKPTGFAEANQLWQQFYVSDEAQAAFPGQELGKLLNTFRQLEEILANVGYVAAIMSGLTIFLAIYSATVAREQMIALMRGVGTGRGIVVGMVIAEALILALLGSLLARALGYAAASTIAGSLAVQNGIPIPTRYVSAIEPLLIGLPIGLALLAGIVPALRTYRLNVVDKLFAS